ncbi:transglutaminase-like domain-containing protein [Acidovorax sp.]|uniref:transglutaminase-like domain-containing protein n=1 Tax=Acidovorax sp. TaxID=1872122 RepID=UPI00391B3FBF
MATPILSLTPSPTQVSARRTPSRPVPQTQSRVRIELQIDLAYEVDDPCGADFVFNIHAAHTPSQRVTHERLSINQAIAHQIETDALTGTRYLRLHAETGALQVSYAATVDITHHRAEPATLTEMPVRDLPLDVLRYIYPSRYCQSDRLLKLAACEFGNLPPGYGRAQAICDWVRNHVTFASNTSNSTTAAVDTLIEKVGVCRDFAHLMIALCRASNLPARFTTGTDYGADPALGPPDFHAYVEVYLGGRWYLFDPSGTAIPMGLMRFGTGRDAADVAFATMFGGVRSHAPVIRTTAIDDAAQGWVLPQHGMDALCTDGGVYLPQAPLTLAHAAKPGASRSSRRAPSGVA